MCHGIDSDRIPHRAPERGTARFWRRAARAIALLILTGSAAAAPPPTDASGALGIEDAVAQALAANPAIAAQKFALVAGQARVAQAESAWQPRVSTSAWYRVIAPVPELNFNTGITPPGAAGPLTIQRTLGTAQSAGVQAQVGWRALDFGARGARVEAAEALTRATRAEGDARAAEIAFAVRAAYLSAGLYEEVAAATARALESARADLKSAEDRHRAGLAGDVGVAASNARVAELEARLVDAGAAGEAARESLALLLGLPAHTPIALTEGLDPPSLAQPGAAPADATPALAKLAATDAALAKEDTARARSRLPTVDLYVQGAYQYPQTFVQTDPGFAWAAGVNLAWDAFDGGLVRAQRDEVAAKRAELAALRQASRDDTARAVADADAKARAARAAVAASARTIAAVEVHLRAARGALTGGTGTDLEVRGAETALDQAHLGRVRARFEAAMAEATRLRALGLARPLS